MVDTLVGQFACAKVHLVLGARRWFGAVHPFDEIVQRESATCRRGAVPIEAFQRPIQGVHQVFALVSNWLLDDTFAQTQFDGVDAAERKVIERNQFVFVIEWKTMQDLCLRHLLANDCLAVG